MKIIKYILIAIYIINSLVLMFLTLSQSKDDEGASGTITGGKTNNFYNQNKGKTKEGKMKKMTIISGILFAVLTIIVSIVYVV